MSANTLGRYKIIREIARSNDVVYEAVDTSFNRRVALKELIVAPNLNGAQKRERVERFYREARAAGSLSHPNIVTIYEAGEDQGRHFIAMEYLEGQTLRTVLDIEGSISVDRTIEVIKQVCDGLGYAHSKGIIHRDIKPDNVQILPTGHVKITDFGIARIMEEPSLTANGQVFGTPSYMSPEQVAGKHLDVRSDIFSLGILIFEMLVGRKPFTGDTVVTITYNIMNQEVAIPPSIPAHLERVISRCLSKDRNQRFSSVAELSEALESNGFYGTQTVSQSQPDPFGSTIGMQTYPPSTQQAPPPSPVPQPDPFGGLRPGDLSLPPRSPRRPLLSAEAKYFLKVLLAVVGGCAFLVLMIWLFSAGYQGWQRQGRENEIRTYLEAGEQYFKQQSYQAAIEEFSKVLKLDPAPQLRDVARHNIAVSYVQLGLQADQAGNTGQAIAYFRQSVASDEDYADGYLFLGNAQKRINHTDEALAAWSRAIELDGGGDAGMTARQSIGVVYHERGDDAFRVGNSSVAVEWWRKAVEIAPGTQVGNLAQQKIDRATGG